MGRDQDAGAGRSTRPVVVGACSRAAAARCPGTRTAGRATSVVVRAARLGRRSAAIGRAGSVVVRAACPGRCPAAVVAPRGRKANGGAGIPGPASARPCRAARRRRGAATREPALGGTGRRRGHDARTAAGG